MCSQVREATADVPDVWLNLAHIYVEEKQFVAAIQMVRVLPLFRFFFFSGNNDMIHSLQTAMFKGLVGQFIVIVCGKSVWTFHKQDTVCQWQSA